MSHSVENSPRSDSERELTELAPELASLRERAVGPDSDPGWAALDSALEQEQGPRAWLRSRSTAARIGLVAATVVAICVYQLLFSRRVDFAVYPEPTMMLSVLAAGLVIGLGVVLETWPLQYRSLPTSLLPLAAGLALMLPLLQGLGPVHEAHPASLEGAGADFVDRAISCFRYGALMSAPFLILLLLVDRQSRGRSAWVGLVALTTGLVANLALLLHCSITHPEHLLVGHAAIGVALTALGLAAVAIYDLRAARRPE
jgi:hypothetical protein